MHQLQGVAKIGYPFDLLTVLEKILDELLYNGLLELIKHIIDLLLQAPQVKFVTHCVQKTQTILFREEKAIWSYLEHLTQLLERIHRREAPSCLYLGDII